MVQLYVYIINIPYINAVIAWKFSRSQMVKALLHDSEMNLQKNWQLVLVLLGFALTAYCKSNLVFFFLF